MCTALWVVCLVFLHVVPTGYNPVCDPVSAYSIGRFSLGYRAQVCLAAAAAVLLAAALPGRPTREIALLAIFAAARVAIAFFPIDRRVPHRVLAIVAFVSIAVCASSYAPRVAGRVAAAGLVGGVVLRPYFGAFERLFYAAIIAWFVVVSVRLL